MSDLAIRAEGLSKRYAIGALRRPATSLREALTRAASDAARAMIGRRQRTVEGDPAQELWALRDVSFDVRVGDTLGIMGGNGAGKSTLLKILSRITDPTTGSARIRGRVASLLEVGAGFNAELTGRENVFLNGAVLGMRRAEIGRKFDEIVAFAEVERFIDTPIKHYSSGMYMRLAFAVAAHLEPEILIVDEALAVGDVAFQRKCLAKMSDIAQGGSTVLFVSHSTDALQRLCARSLLLEHGRVVAFGPTEEIVTGYLLPGVPCPPPGKWADVSRARRRGSGEACWVAARYTGDAAMDGRVYAGGPIEFTLALTARASLDADAVAVTIHAPSGTKLASANSLYYGQVLHFEPGRNEVVVQIDALHLTPGTYQCGLWLSNEQENQLFDDLEAAFEIRVEDPGALGLEPLPSSAGYVPCRFRIASGASVAPTAAAGR
jgi:lipopolysaccharide transport system ATP-binding protein